MLITTAATRLRGVAGVHALHTNTALVSLVRYEGPESGKRPTMQPALSPVGPARCDARTDGGHVLHGKCGALWHAPDDALAHHVVMIAAAGRLARQAAQVALSALGPCGLERAPELEVPRFQVAPAALPMKAIVTGHGGAGHAQVHAHHGISGGCLQCGHVYNDMQIPVAAFLQWIKDTPADPTRAHYMVKPHASVPWAGHVESQGEERQ